jgi:hypothetical protein
MKSSVIDYRNSRLFQEGIDGRGVVHINLANLINFALYYAVKKAIAEIRQIFSFLPEKHTVTFCHVHKVSPGIKHFSTCRYRLPEHSQKAFLFKKEESAV